MIPLGSSEVHLGRLAGRPDTTKFDFETGLVTSLNNRASQVKGNLRLGLLRYANSGGAAGGS